jgi:transcriptional regulator with XRE-family HTH domain
MPIAPATRVGSPLIANLSAANSANLIEQVGNRIKKLRVERGLTLADLSAKTGLPISTLSKIENGRTALGFDKLTKLAAGLDTEVSDLLQSPDSRAASPMEHAIQPGRRSLTRSDEGLEVKTLLYDYRYVATDLLKKVMTPMLMSIKTRGPVEEIELSRHAGEEFIIILEGEITLVTEYYAPVVLQRGDTMYFDARMGHAYINNGEQNAVLLSISSASAEELEAARTPSISE